MKLLLLKKSKYLGYFHNKYYTGPWENAIYIKTSDAYIKSTGDGMRKLIFVAEIEIDEYTEKNWI